MPQGYDPGKPPKPAKPAPTQSAPSAVQNPVSPDQGKPRYQGKLKPQTYMTPNQIQMANGPGMVKVYAHRHIEKDKVETAIRWWNAAAGAPLFSMTNHQASADVIVRISHNIAGDTTGAIADAEVKNGQFFVNIPYQPVRASLVAHELGHTVGLGDMYTQQDYLGPAAFAAGATTKLMSDYMQSQPEQNPLWAPGAGAHRIMFGGGAPSQAEARVALQEVGLDPETLGIIQYGPVDDHKKRAQGGTRWGDQGAITYGG